MKLLLRLAIPLALPIVAGVVEAVRRAWVCDDIFITFRYVEHLTQGFGLVYNAGERVMGYTHFLWAIVLAACARFGFDLVTLGRYLPLVPWVLVLALLFARALGVGLAAGASGAGVRPAWPAAARSPWLALPAAAWGVALHRDWQNFASGGLETALFALLLLAAALLITARRPAVELAAVAYGLATLVRPEGAAYTAIAAGFVCWRWRAIAPLRVFVAVYAALVVPFVIWQWAYYGSLVPNAYHAKSAGASYWQQGWIYTALYFRIYAVVTACAVLAAALWLVARLRRAAAGAAPPFETSHGLVALALIQTAFTVLYVTRIGGDFMFARFYLPVTPLVYLAAEEAVRRTGRRAAMAGLAVAVAAGTLAARIPHARTFHACEQVSGIVDEAQCYGDDYIASLKEQGDVLRRLFTGTQARVLVTGGQAMLAYWGQLPYAMEGTGLTHKEFARQPLEKRGRPGHEKGASDDFLRRNRVHFRVLYGAHRAVGLREHEKLLVGRMIVRIFFYDPDIMQELATRPGVTFVDFPKYLDGFAVADLRRYSPQVLLSEFEHFYHFYFQLNPDPDRLERVRGALVAAGVSAADLDAVSRR